MTREYLTVVVKPNLEAMSTGVADPRLTYNAVATADALAAHIFYWCRANAPAEVSGLKDISAYRQEQKKHKANAALMYDVAKALKHVELDRGAPRIRLATDILPQQFGYEEGAYGVGPFGGGEQMSAIVDGRKVQLAWTIRSVVEFYEGEMDRLRIP